MQVCFNPNSSTAATDYLQGSNKKSIKKESSSMKSTWSTAAIAAAAFGVGVAASDAIRNLNLSGIMTGFSPLSSLGLRVPDQAQLFDPAQYAVIDEYSDYNGLDVYVPSDKTLKQMVDKPFHVYDEEFLRILGPNPTLTVVAETETNPLFHEAVVWYPPTDEAFFAQNAGPPSAGTGLNKSSILQKISLKEAMSVASGDSSKVQVVHVDAKPTVLNPNGEPPLPLSFLLPFSSSLLCFFPFLPRYHATRTPLIMS